MKNTKPKTKTVYIIQLHSGEYIAGVTPVHEKNKRPDFTLYQTWTKVKNKAAEYPTYSAALDIASELYQKNKIIPVKSKQIK